MVRSSLLCGIACLVLVACTGTQSRSSGEGPARDRDLLLRSHHQSLSKSLEEARPLVDLGTAD